MIMLYFGLFCLLFLIGLTIAISNSKGIGYLITIILAFIGGNATLSLSVENLNFSQVEFGIVLTVISFGTLVGYFAGYKFRVYILKNQPDLPIGGNFLGFLIPYSKDTVEK